MKTKKLLFVVMIFVLAVTAACGGEATPVPATEAPVESPAEAAPVVEETVASAPAEAPAEAPTEVPTEAPADVPTEEPVEAPTEAPAQENPAPAPAPDFLLPDDASNTMVIGEGVTTFQTALSMPDVITFYRFGFPDYTERDALTEFSEASFQIVFDGHESGKAVIVQGFSLGEGAVSVSIRLGDV